MIRNCQAVADAVHYFHLSGGSICLRELTLQQLPAQNDVMVAVLELSGEIENLSPSIDAYLFEEHSYKI